MSVPPKRRKLVRLLAALTLSAAVGSAVVIAVAPWERIQRQVIRDLIKRVQPYVPFEIESFDVKTKWKDFRNGKITNLKLVLRKENVRLILSGPLSFRQLPREKGYAAVYEPEANVTDTAIFHKFEVKFPLTLSAEVPKNLDSLHRFELNSNLAELRVPQFGVHAKDLKLDIAWINTEASVHFSGKELTWTDPKSAEHVVQIQGPRIEGKTAVQINPFHAGDLLTLNLSSTDGELLWDNFYLELPLREYPVSLTAKNFLVQPAAAQVAVKIGEPKKPELTILGGLSGQRLSLRMHAPSLSLPKYWKQAAALPAFQGLADLKIHNGLLTLKAESHAPASALDRLVQNARGKMEISNLDAELKPKAIAIQNGRASVEFPKGEGNFSAASLYFQRFKAALPATPIHYDWNLSGNKLLRFQMPKGLPLVAEKIPLKIGPIKGSIHKTFDYSVETSFSLQRTAFATLAQTVCQEKKKIPPGFVEVNFPEMELRPGTIDPSGKVRAELFDGFVEIDEIGIFDFLTEVPEIDFNARWDGLQLQRIGTWLNFGKMEGILTGHANDVTFQSWLPTHYDFRIEAKPNPGKGDVVFSPQAMRNVIRVFADDGIEQLPGIVDWLAFGWPSEFWGYDVDYAGVQIFSSDGGILLETLDPPKILRKERKHYFLYGPRFRMPLMSSHYPLVVDASAMGNFVRNTLKVLESLSASMKAASTDTETDKENNNETNSICLSSEWPF